MKYVYKQNLLAGAILLVSAANLAWAQSQSSPVAGTPNAPIAYDDRDQAAGGWRRLGQRGPAEPNDPRGYAAQPPAWTPANLPAQLMIPSGTFVTIRVNQAISSDHNYPGEPFSASLVKPIVVDGIVVADRGQTIAGRIVEAVKAGKIKGVSRLGFELTELTLVDGTQVPLRSQLITYQGPTSIGRDATAVGMTSAIGAMIGGIEGGAEAGLGAAAGAGAALIGVLLTRGHPTVVSPEAVLTFRVETPIAINTTRSPQAFRSVSPVDYNHPADQPRMLMERPAAPAPAYYGGWGYPSFWGYPGGWGVGWWGPGYYYGPAAINLGFSYGYGRGYGWGHGGGYGHGGHGGHGR